MELHITCEGRQLTFEEPREVVVGRDPDSDIWVADDRVSRKHAVVRPAGRGWELVDLESTNGTYTGGQRVSVVPVGTFTEIRLGNPDDGPGLVLSARSAGSATTVVGRPAPPPTARPVRPRAPGMGRMSAINRLVHDLDVPEESVSDDATGEVGPERAR